MVSRLSDISPLPWLEPFSRHTNNTMDENIGHPRPSLVMASTRQQSTQQHEHLKNDDLTEMKMKLSRTMSYLSRYDTQVNDLIKLKDDINDVKYNSKEFPKVDSLPLKSIKEKDKQHKRRTTNPSSPLHRQDKNVRNDELQELWDERELMFNQAKEKYETSMSEVRSHEKQLEKKISSLQKKSEDKKVLMKQKFQQMEMINKEKGDRINNLEERWMDEKKAKEKYKKRLSTYLMECDQKTSQGGELVNNAIVDEKNLDKSPLATKTIIENLNERKNALDRRCRELTSREGKGYMKNEGASDEKKSIGSIRKLKIIEMDIGSDLETKVAHVENRLATNDKILRELDNKKQLLVDKCTEIFDVSKTSKQVKERIVNDTAESAKKDVSSSDDQGSSIYMLEEVNTTKISNEKLKSKVVTLEDALNERNADLKVLHEKKHKLDKVLKKLILGNKNLSLEYCQFKKDNEVKCINQNKKLQETIDQLKKERDGYKMDYEISKDTQRLEMEEHQRRIQEFKNNLVLLQQSKSRLECQLETIKMENKTKVSELEIGKAEQQKKTIEHKKRLVSLEQSNKEIKRQLEELRDEKDTFKLDKGEESKNRQELLRLHQLEIDLKIQVDELRKENFTQRSELRQEKMIRQEMRRADLKVIEESKLGLQNEVDKLRRERDGFKIELDSLNNESLGLKDQIIEQEHQHEESSERIHMLEIKLQDTWQDRLKEKETFLRLLETNVNKANGLEKKLRDTLKERYNLQRQLKESKACIASSQVYALTRERDNLKKYKGEQNHKQEMKVDELKLEIESFKNIIDLKSEPDEMDSLFKSEPTTKSKNESGQTNDDKPLPGTNLVKDTNPILQPIFKTESLPRLDNDYRLLALSKTADTTLLEKKDSLPSLHTKEKLTNKTPVSDSLEKCEGRNSSHNLFEDKKEKEKNDLESGDVKDTVDKNHDLIDKHNMIKQSANDNKKDDDEVGNEAELEEIDDEAENEELGSEDEDEDLKDKNEESSQQVEVNAVDNHENDDETENNAAEKNDESEPEDSEAENESEAVDNAGESDNESEARDNAGESDNDSEPDDSAGESDNENDARDNAGESDNGSEPEDSAGEGDNKSEAVDKAGKSDNESEARDNAGESDNDSEPDDSAGESDNENDARDNAGEYDKGSGPEDSAGEGDNKSEAVDNAGESDNGSEPEDSARESADESADNAVESDVSGDESNESDVEEELESGDEKEVSKKQIFDGKIDGKSSSDASDGDW